jgi:hypothetical protein
MFRAFSVVHYPFFIMKLRFGIVAGIFLAIFTLYPQMKMVYLRGDEWNGHYAYNDIDEVAYASYVRALIDGRPRKNDPYTGHDESAATPQPESLFSIQFAAPYTIAIPARIFGIGTPWAMTLAGAFAGFLAALAVFWLVGSITGDSWYAMAASLVVFCGGALFAGEGAVLEVFFDGFSYPYFPGFRRYIPALAFPAFFAMVGCVWKLLSSPPYKGGVDAASADGVVLSSPQEDLPPTGRSATQERTTPSAKRGHPSFVRRGALSASPRLLFSASQLIYGALAVLCFAYTAFSYFYVWTTAVAWLGCVFIVWLVWRPDDWLRDLKKIAAVGAGCVLALIPYAYLLSRRSQSMDDVQLLVNTRMPDLARMPEYISIVCLFLLIFGIARKIIGANDRSTLFALSLALVPIVVFNQQIITGRSLQPIHYQVFIGNYVAGLALMVTVGILWKRRLAEGGIWRRAACAAIALLAIFWGFVECHYTVRVLDDANIERDIAMPVGKRLEELAKRDSDPHRTTVLAYDMIQSDDLPTIAPQNVLWSRHQHVFAGLTWQESKERYYQFLYYSNVDPEGLDYALKNDFVAKISLFGWGRHSDRLSVDAKPLTYGEVADEVRRYAAYRANFGVKQASSPLISYVVVNSEADTDLSQLDKWYERDDGEFVGKYTLYSVRLRANP